MKLTPDTNILVRAVVVDDHNQAVTARRFLAETDHVVLTLPALCELAWVLKTYYKTPLAQIAAVLRGLVAVDNIIVDVEAVDAGLAVLDAGGDFADGVIAASGYAHGADAFVSFDRKAIQLLTAAGYSARLPD